MMNKFYTSFVKWCKPFAIIALIIFTAYSCEPTTQSVLINASFDSSFNTSLNFPTQLSSTFPFDVDESVKASLEKDQKFDEVQRLFEVLSWQAFVGLNWPYENGKPQAKITSDGQPLWDSWEESFEVFRADGGKPTPWGHSYNLPDRLKDKLDPAECSNILYRTSKFSHKKHTDFADEIDQAFSTSIWDQNGNIVRYEVRMNEVEFDYIVKNELYNLDGQIAFAKRNKSPLVNFPTGTRTKQGAIEIKLAWKIIPEGDKLAGRYYTREACVMNEDKESFSSATVGLIGMHIAMKTKSSPQWIWATFEQVDNLEANPLETYNGEKLKPSFYDPKCPLCPVNVLPSGTEFESYTANKGRVTNTRFLSSNFVPKEHKGNPRNQIQRMLPIPMATQALNKEVQNVLKGANSPLQYYQLIGTQWPTKPNEKPYPVHDGDNPILRSLPEAVTNKSGGMPTPVYLTNMVMETYFQGATEDSVYNYLLANEPAYTQIEGFPKNTTESGTRIFGTESCIGCHSSSSIAVKKKINPKTGKPVAEFAKRQDHNSEVIGDFSWLLQMKAKFKKEK